MIALGEEVLFRTLDADGWHLRVTDRGGCILRCDWNGQPVLCEAGLAQLHSPFDAGCFPMAPYSNRIGGGGFVFAGRKVDLSSNVKGEAFPLHGSAWLGDWATIAHDATSISQLFVAAPSHAWPWPFALNQKITINGATLSVSLRFESRANQPAPAGLGLHPYFPDPAGATLAFKAKGVWLADSQNLPSAWRAVKGEWDFAAGRALSDVAIDNCYTNWTGEARIVWRERGLTLDICADAPARFAVVYVPRDQSSFCFEPVSHMNDALNWANRDVDTGLRILKPHESFAIEMRIHAQGLDA